MTSRCAAPGCDTSGTQVRHLGSGRRFISIEWPSAAKAVTLPRDARAGDVLAAIRAKLGARATTRVG